MSLSEFERAMDLAAGVTGPPYDLGAARALCDVLEQILASELDRESSWSRFDWLDGFIATMLERQSNRVTVRGGVWVNAVRPEPCEIEVQLAPLRSLKVKFMDNEGTSAAGDAGRLKFPPQRTWRYVFTLGDRNDAGQLLDTAQPRNADPIRADCHSHLPCPACGFLTVPDAAYGSYNICELCGWEDDGVQLANPACGGGANRESLIEAQARALDRFPLSTSETAGISRSSLWRPLSESEQGLAHAQRVEKYWMNHAIVELAECYWMR
jgi:hypothetical protein